MAYTGYYTEQSLRDKLGNTIGSNYSVDLLDKARRGGDAFVDSETHKESKYQDGLDSNVIHAWKANDLYYGRAVAISMKYACAFVRSTQVNVSIQEQREWNEAVADSKMLYDDLISSGQVETSARFATNNFVTDVLNPYGGTIVTGLNGIVKRYRLLDYDTRIY